MAIKPYKTTGDRVWCPARPKVLSGLHVWSSAFYDGNVMLNKCVACHLYIGWPYDPASQKSNLGDGFECVFTSEDQEELTNYIEVFMVLDK